MKKLLPLALLLVASAAFPADPTDKDAMAMVDKAAAFMKNKGKAELVNRVRARDADVAYGSLYLEVVDLRTGVTLANPVNPAYNGKNMVDVPDASGKKFRRDIMQLAQAPGRGWVDYLVKDTLTGKTGRRTVYIRRVDDVVLEASMPRK